ncbi:MAG TPA: DUF3600 domain-containing protein [Paenibacillus sp.]|jgi:hypothetical protein
MSLDEELRSAFQEESKKWIAPPELKESILKQVVSKQGGRRMKKWLVVSILAATLLIPTGVYAGYNYLADSIYGSQESVASMGGTQQKYDELEAKLQNAKQSFSEEEFTTLMSLLKKLGSFNLKYADAEGVLHPEQLGADEQETLNRLTAELEPFNTKLSEVETPRKEIDMDTFWNGVFEEAEQTFSKEGFTDFKKIVTEMRSYDAKVTDPDRGVHMKRLTEKDKKDLDQLQEQLRPYFDKLGIMMKPSS